MKKSPVKYASIPYMVFKSIAQREKVVEDIKTKLIEDQNKIDHIQPSLVFYRGDNRNPESIRAAGGFFGRAPITVEHARYIVPFWVSKDMKQRWKVNTGNFGDTPIVATSISEGHKGDYHYKIEIPIPQERKAPQPYYNSLNEEGASAVSASGLLLPFMLHEKEKLKDSHIIGLHYDDEVAFFTGIPKRWITKWKKISEHGDWETFEQ